LNRLDIENYTCHLFRPIWSKN